MRHTDGSAVSTSFLLDDLRWLERDSIKTDPSVDSLRKYAANTHLSVGSSWTLIICLASWMQNSPRLSPRNSILSKLQCKWSDIEPSEGVFDFTKTGCHGRLRPGNHLAVFAYTDAEHTYLPSLAVGIKASLNWTDPTNYIDTIVGHYKGKIAIWNVFNEVVNNAGTGFKNRQSPYTGVVPNEGSTLGGWKRYLFDQGGLQTGADVRPDAKLLLNDYYTEEIGRPKSEFFYNLVKELVTEGVPIDAVGFEMHIYYPPLRIEH